jgi:membrane protease YdiL (CAAX protease family)
MQLKPFPFFFWSFALAGLSSPTVAALIMFIRARDTALWRDFGRRLSPRRIRLSFLPFIVGFVPCMLLLATSISIVFGGSLAQFSLKRLSDQALESQSFVSIAFIMILLCCLEEIGWRGYGIPSLRTRYNLLRTSAVFGVLWFSWHIPAFFIRNGAFQKEIWDLSIVHVLNYILTLLAVTFFINWVYVKNGRSILAPIGVHASMNITVAIFPIEPFTKIIFMLLMTAAAVALVRKERALFLASTRA